MRHRSRRYIQVPLQEGRCTVEPVAEYVLGLREAVIGVIGLGFA